MKKIALLLVLLVALVAAPFAVAVMVAASAPAVGEQLRAECADVTPPTETGQPALAPASAPTPGPAARHPSDLAGSLPPAIAGRFPAQIGPWKGVQIINAAYAAKAAYDLGFDIRTAQLGVTAMIGESSLMAVTQGDAAGPDSRGFYGQRDYPTIFGTTADRMNPYISARNFYKLMVSKVANYAAIDPSLAIHLAQQNSDENHYTPMWPDGVQIVAAFTRDPSLLSSLPPVPGVAAADARTAVDNPIPGVPPALTGDAAAAPNAAPGAAAPAGEVSSVDCAAAQGPTDPPGVGSPGSAPAAGAPVVSGRWANPLAPAAYVKTSPFGPRGAGFHYGQDMAVPVGTPVRSVCDGTIIGASFVQGGGGNQVMTDCGGGIRTKLMHNSVIYVQLGQKVTAGQVVAASGSTGHSTGPHCHLQVEIGGVPVDPVPFMSQRGVPL